MDPSPMPSPGPTGAPAAAESPPQRAEGAGQPLPPLSPRVEVTTLDGRRISLSKRQVEQATIATSAEGSSNPYSHVLLFDSGFGGLDMCVALAKKGLAAIVHIKSAHALFPKAALDDRLRGAPGGSHLECDTTIDGIKFIAVGYKYNSKKTLFFLAPEGAAGTVDGEPYVTKWPDEHGNVMTRNVLRLVLASRYFLSFMKVDKHNQLRQHELALETTWRTDDGWFRLFCTLVGITIIDTMLTLRSESHSEHQYKTMRTGEFAEILAEEMVMNTLDGHHSRPRKHGGAKVVAKAPIASMGENAHVLQKIGKVSGRRRLKEGEKDGDIQRRCSECKKKCSYFCSALICKQANCCKSTKRRCYENHLMRWKVSLEAFPDEPAAPLRSPKRARST